MISGVVKMLLPQQEELCVCKAIYVKQFYHDISQAPSPRPHAVEHNQNEVLCVLSEDFSSLPLAVRACACKP